MGLRLSEVKVEKAFVKVIHQELALTEGRGPQKLGSQKPLHLMEKRAATKTTPSATKAESSGAKTTKEVRKPEEVYAPDRKLPIDKHGNKIPDADVPHTQLGIRVSKKLKNLMLKQESLMHKGSLLEI